MSAMMIEHDELKAFSRLSLVTRRSSLLYGGEDED
jgi:hypothetical protein